MSAGTHRTPLNTDIFSSVYLSQDTCPIDDQKMLLRNLGFKMKFKRKGPIPTDSSNGHLMSCTAVPQGWTYVESEGDYLRSCYDQKGHKRFSLSESKDPRTLMPCCRYEIQTRIETGDATVVDNATGSVIQLFTGTIGTDEAQEEAAEWLEGRRPEYNDFNAYWDEVPPLQAND